MILCKLSRCFKIPEINHGYFWQFSLLLMSFFATIAIGNRNSKTSKESEIEMRPVFKPTNKNITVGPGDRAVLKCKVENLGTKTVTWRKQDDVHPLTIGMFPFAPDTRMTVDYNQRTMEWSLIIQDVKPTDEGVYRCQISTKNDRHSYDIKLNVKNYMVYTAIQVSGTEYIERGNSIQLVCNVTGKPDPPLNIDWYIGNVKINADTQSGIIITKKIETRILVSMLVIKNSQPDNSGEYVCKSSDKESSSIKVHVLNVAGPAVDKQGSSSDVSRMYGGNEATVLFSRNILNFQFPVLLTFLIAR